MTIQTISIVIVSALLVAMGFSRPWRAFFAMPFKALICIVSLLFMGLGRRKVA